MAKISAQSSSSVGSFELSCRYAFYLRIVGYSCMNLLGELFKISLHYRVRFNSSNKMVINKQSGWGRRALNHCCSALILRLREGIKLNLEVPICEKPSFSAMKKEHGRFANFNQTGNDFILIRFPP